MSWYCNYCIIPIGFASQWVIFLRHILRIVSSKLKLIWSTLFELYKVFLLNCCRMNNVAGKYIDHKQYTLTVLTIAHADHGRPKLKDDERFRNGFFCDLKYVSWTCAYSINLNREILEESYTKLFKFTADLFAFVLSSCSKCPYFGEVCWPGVFCSGSTFDFIWCWTVVDFSWSIIYPWGRLVAST